VSSVRKWQSQEAGDQKGLGYPGQLFKGGKMGGFDRENGKVVSFREINEIGGLPDKIQLFLRIVWR
jgi:hypothetical protein